MNDGVNTVGEVKRRPEALGNPFVGALWQRLHGAAYKTGARARVVLFRYLSRLRRRETEPLADLRPERILWVRLDHIGDAILSRPALQALRNHYPDAAIDALIHPLCAQLYSGDPAIRNVFTYTTRQFRREKANQSILRLIWRLRCHRYDLAVETRGDDASRVLAFLAGARRIAGPAAGPYESPGVENTSFLLTDPVSSERMPKLPCHASDISLGILEELGLVRADGPYPREMPTDDCWSQAIETLADLGIDRPFAAIHAASSAPYKSWPTELFAEVADWLVRKHGLLVVLTGTPADESLNEKIIGLSNEETGRIVNGAGLFGLLDLPMLYRRAKLVVTVDTGPMHVAAAAGAPIVALMLPWNAAIFHPYGQADGVVCPPAPEEWLTIEDPDRIMRYLQSNGWVPLQAVGVEEVIEAIDRKLAMTMLIAGRR